VIDGVHLGEHCLIVALGTAADGQKDALIASGPGQSSAARIRPPT
jgi:hypothetical protein